MVMLDNDNKISTSESNRIGDFINNGSNWIFKPAIAIDMDLRSHFVSDRHR